MLLRNKQKAVLTQLNIAMAEADACGLYDMLAEYVNADVIDQFRDGVSELSQRAFGEAS